MHTYIHTIISSNHLKSLRWRKIKAAELLLDITSEIKTQLIVTNSETVEQWRQQRNKQLHEFTCEARMAMESAMGDVATLLQASEMELAL